MKYTSPTGRQKLLQQHVTANERLASRNLGLATRHLGRLITRVSVDLRQENSEWADSHVEILEPASMLGKRFKSKDAIYREEHVDGVFNTKWKIDKVVKGLSLTIPEAYPKQDGTRLIGADDRLWAPRGPDIIDPSLYQGTDENYHLYQVIGGRALSVPQLDKLGMASLEQTIAAVESRTGLNQRAE